MIEDAKEIASPAIANQTSKVSDNETHTLSEGAIAVAFEKLFAGGRGVLKFTNSGLRYVKLDTHGTLLIEQNPAKKSEWAQLAKQGKRIAWVMRDGQYLVRVVEGEVTMLDAEIS